MHIPDDVCTVDDTAGLLAVDQGDLHGVDGGEGVFLVLEGPVLLLFRIPVLDCLQSLILVLGEVQKAIVEHTPQAELQKTGFGLPLLIQHIKYRSKFKNRT